MVAPVTGPFTKYVDEPGYQLYRVWSRQKRPYTLTLEYNTQIGYAWGPNGLGSLQNAWRYKTWASEAQSRYHDAAYAKAYARLVDKLGETASMGINLAQWKQADQMITKRAKQLGSFTSALVRRSPVGVAASLGLRLKDVTKIMKARHGASKKLSDLWLEFWFGWKPAVMDIYSACEVFSQDIPSGHVKERGVVRAQEPNAQKPPISWANSEGISFDSIRVGAAIGIDVKVTNPDLHLLNQMGLINPAQVVWDAIPWSFVLGWFSNVDSYLSSLSDFAGMTTSNGYVTRYCVLEGHTYTSNFGVVSMTPFGSYGKGVYVHRAGVTSLPRPPLVFSLKPWKPTRGLTAISLLVQKLPKH